MLQLCELYLFLVVFLLFHPPPFFSSSFHYNETAALLHFKSQFSIFPNFVPRFNFSYCGYPKTKSWKEDVDCCSWDGITCDASSGHIIGIDLSCSQLGGIFHTNSSLFHLPHLHSLNLAFNDFYLSSISPNFGRFSALKVLNLSHSLFAGVVPVELHLLSGLLILDLSSDYDVTLQMPHFDVIMRNLTNLNQLQLSYVSINSALPQTLSNLSSLTSLDLFDCYLEGAFPRNIMKLSHLRSLVVGYNPNLNINPSQFNNFTTSLEFLDFTYANMSGTLPEYSIGSHPPRLREIRLFGCNLNGPIPTWIWNTTDVISLGLNKFTGGLPLNMNPKVLSQLTYIRLDRNMLEGPIPLYFFTLPSILLLDFAMNRFSGKLDGVSPIGNASLHSIYLQGNNLSFELLIFSKMEYLTYLSLSNNVISMTGGVNTPFYWPNLSRLYLRSCNLSEFPNFSSSKYLEVLDISDNIIQGELPTWLYGVGRNSLYYLNISHNNLIGVLELLPWNSLYTVDIHSNSFQGWLPLPPPIINSFSASNNQFHGELSSSFCNLTAQLQFLDLSNNRLIGELPSCLGKLSHNLEVLNLGSNIFHGSVYIKLKKHCSLISIHLDKNQFEGKVPSSVKRCKSLQVLNLGNNRFNGSFPCWLDAIPTLQVLILKSNNFQGPIKDCYQRNKHPFPNLQILDLSENRFSGRLPTRYIENFQALMDNNGGDIYRSLEIEGTSTYYQDSVVMTLKGTTLTYTYKILTILTALDFSNNMFSAELPDSIGNLTALVFLNVSNNKIIGLIPLSMANLYLLESLDLSSNKLEGNIPAQLVQLKFLEKFNVSNNQLVGPVPSGFQFNTFQSDSYIGNPSLCGDPLPKCGSYNHQPLTHQPVTPSSQFDFFDFVTSFSLLAFIFIGFGFGAIVGVIAGGCMLFTVRPLWFSREVDKLEYKIVQIFKKHSRIWQRT